MFNTQSIHSTPWLKVIKIAEILYGLMEYTHCYTRLQNKIQCLPHPLMSHQTWHIGHWCPIICIKFTFHQKKQHYLYTIHFTKKNQHYLYKLYKIHFPQKKSTLHKHLCII